MQKRREIDLGSLGGGFGNKADHTPVRTSCHLHLSVEIRPSSLTCFGKKAYPPPLTRQKKLGNYSTSNIQCSTSRLAG